MSGLRDRELTAPQRLAAFGGLLAAVFAASLGVGALTGEQGPAAAAEPAAAPADSHGPGTAHGASGGDAAGSGHSGAGHSAGGHSAGHSAAEPTAATGTSSTADGLRLDVAATVLPAGTTTPYSFRVLDDEGRVLRDGYEVEQGKLLHLVVVDRGLTVFRHEHPELADDGTWTTPLELPAGSYRVVADLQRDGVRSSLAADLLVPGPVTAAALPPVSDRSAVDGFDVALERRDSQLSFAVTRGGSPVALEDYLGAKGHLVAFRASDLAYAHVHPVEDLSFEADLPSAGTYRLFLQFQVDGVVRTAPFTLEVTP